MSWWCFGDLEGVDGDMADGKAGGTTRSVGEEVDCGQVWNWD